MTTIEFVEQNSDRSFESWKGWYCSFGRSSGYDLSYSSEGIDYPFIYVTKRDNDSIFLRFEIIGASGEYELHPKIELLPLENLSQDSVWINIYSKHINETDFKSNIQFLSDYYLIVTKIHCRSDLIFFEGRYIGELLYMFHPVDSGFMWYNNRIAPNWFTQEDKENK